MPYFDRDGFRMHYEVHSRAVAVDTVLIHGNVASNDWWEPVVSGFDRRARESGQELQGRLILGEWRGCGRSGGPQGVDDLRMDRLARDYVALLQFLGVTRAHVVGHSTGGLIALLAMAEKPELFLKAVLLDPITPKCLSIDPALIGRMERIGRDRQFAEAVMATTIHGCNTDSALFGRIVDAAFRTHPTNRAGVLEALSCRDMETTYRDRIRSLRHPVWILHGEYDTILPWQDSQRLAELLPDGRFDLLDGQGHSCNVENPERFVQLSERFLFH